MGKVVWSDAHPIMLASLRCPRFLLAFCGQPTQAATKLLLPDPQTPSGVTHTSLGVQIFILLFPGLIRPRKFLGSWLS